VGEIQECFIGWPSKILISRRVGRCSMMTPGAIDEVCPPGAERRLIGARWTPVQSCCGKTGFVESASARAAIRKSANHRHVRPFDERGDALRCPMWFGRLRAVAASLGCMIHAKTGRPKVYRPSCVMRCPSELPVGKSLWKAG